MSSKYVIEYLKKRKGNVMDTYSHGGLEETFIRLATGTIASYTEEFNTTLDNGKKLSPFDPIEHGRLADFLGLKRYTLDVLSSTKVQRYIDRRGALEMNESDIIEYYDAFMEYTNRIEEFLEEEAPASEEVAENSYLWIARNAKRGVALMFNKNARNEFATSAQRVAVEYLKAVLEKYPNSKCKSDILQSESLHELYDNLEHLNYISINKEMIDLLDAYRFKASHPGNNFTVVMGEQEIGCYASLVHISEKVEKFFSKAQTTNEF